VPYTSQSPFVAGPLSVASLELLRTNLAESAGAKATTAGRHFAVTGSGSIAERASVSDVDDSVFSTSSTTYVNATTVGPTVTVTTGVQAFVHLYSFISSNVASTYALYGFDVTGATTQAVNDNRALYVATFTAGVGMASSATILVTGLTPGSNTFTVKYKVIGAVTATFDHRRLSVFPL
jgi:hypothetical protein